MRSLLLSVLLLAVGTAAGAPIPFPKLAKLDEKSDHEEVQGEWELVFMSGCVAPGVKLEFAGENWSLRDARPQDGVNLEGTFTLAHAGKRKQIVFSISVQGSIVPREVSGVYRLKGDLLTIRQGNGADGGMVLRRLSRPDRSKRMVTVR
jgi:hypothetical protein